jgi:hypothetical protein
MAKFFAGIDPGFAGAIAWMNAAGTTLNVRDMPVTAAKKERQREIDLYGLRDVFAHLRRLPDCYVGIEWPTTRPGEGAERCERFGRGKGYLEAFAFLKGLQYAKIAPNLWKGRLGLDGKEHAGANERAAELFEQLYPAHTAIIRGPRGGILDGRLDALMIAHGMRIGIFQAKYSEFVEAGKLMRQNKFAR